MSSSNLEEQNGFCEYCNGSCLGHKQPAMDVSDRFTVKGWYELMKILNKEDATLWTMALGNK